LALLLLVPFSLFACGSNNAAPELARVVPQVSPVHPRRLQFSPTDNNRLLVMEASGLVAVWDVTDPRQPQLFASIRASATDARFSTDAKGIVTVGIDGYVRWWDVDGTLRWTSAARHDGWARTIAMAPTRIFTGGEDGKIRCWTLDGAADGEPLAAHEGSVLSLDVAANGDLLSLGSDEVVRLWKRGPDASRPAYTAQELYRELSPRHSRMLPSLLRLDVQWGWDRAAAFSPRGDAIAASLFDGAIRLWNADGTPRKTIEKAHSGHHIRSLAFSADGTVLASVGFDGALRLWNADGSPHGDRIEAHRGPALGVAIAGDGRRVASAGVDDNLRFWNFQGTTLGDFPRPYSDRVRSFSMAPRSRVFVCGEAGGAVSVWNLDGSPNGKPFTGHRGAADAVAFSSREDLVVSGGKDATVRLSKRDGVLVAPPFTGHIDGVISVAMSPDGTQIASGSRNDTLRIWNLEGEEVRALRGLRDMITDIVFSPDGKLLAATDAPGEFMLWNADGTVHTNVVKAHKGFLAKVAFSPDGTLLASGGADNMVKLWNLDGSPQSEPLAGHLAAVQTVAFTPDGKVLASGSLDGTVRLWNLVTRDARVLFVGIGVNQIGFLGSQLWVRADGETLLFYDMDLRLQTTLMLRRDAVLSFTPDGWFFGPADASRFVRLFGRDGQLLNDAATAAHFSAERVRAAVAPR
jgi:WD40 repeat protein